MALHLLSQCKVGCPLVVDSMEGLEDLGCRRRRARDRDREGR